MIDDACVKTELVGFHCLDDVIYWGNPSFFARMAGVADVAQLVEQLIRNQ
jgi:hypothetical protein